MNFHHLAYWQDKALSLAIENRLFINGEYTAAAENETFETVDPVTQAPLAKIARGKSVDIDRAMSAARGVFERGDWSLSSPAKRKAVLNKLADLMEAHAEELALLETLDTGKPIRHSLRDDIPGSSGFSEPEKPDEPQVVINQDDLIEMGSQGVSMKLVHNGNPNRTLAMIFETYQPGTTTGERIKHQGEEIGTVLEGEIVLTINGQDYHLVAGQSYAINTGIPHSFSNTSAGICRIISAHTPTTF